MLNGALQPIYVLDDRRTVVFYNRACRDWLGPAADSLLGCRCDYHSVPPANDHGASPDNRPTVGNTAATADTIAMAAGLCPPPEVMSGIAAAATVAPLEQHLSDLTQRAHPQRVHPFGGEIAARQCHRLRR